MPLSRETPAGQSEFDLVTFRHPPVQEVALSVQFAPETFDFEAFGRFARHVHRELPERQRQPVLPPMVESFETVAAPTSMQIRLEAPTAIPRTWFQSTDGVYLVQLQHDRVILNWRGHAAESEYPRYEQLRKRFREYVTILTDALKEVDIGHAANLCEVTYINPVAVSPSDKMDAGLVQHPDLAKVINRLKPRPANAFLPDAEDAQLVARWRITPPEGSQQNGPVGRLYLNASPGLQPPGLTPVYLIQLTAHVIPVASDVESAFQSLDLAHKWVVLGFRDLTTPEMHRVWGLKEQAS